MQKIIVYTDSDKAFNEVIQLLISSTGNADQETFWDIPLDDDLDDN